MTDRIEQLEGAELDAAVARCEGWTGATAELGPLFGYSAKWEHGGPIIERHLAGVYLTQGYAQHLGMWTARTFADFEYRGPTPLIAAMRAYVASKG